MDVIIPHWVGLMVENEAVPDRFGYTVADNMTLFYAYYGLIDSTIRPTQWGMITSTSILMIRV